MNNKGKITQDDATNWFPSKVKSKCPAIMLAANRTDNVTGRMMFLINSIITINGIKTAGVPEGTKWAKNSVILLIILYEIKPNQKGRAKAKVTARCLVAVNVNEIRPTVLLNKIIKNNEEKIRTLLFLFLSNVENSEIIVLRIFMMIIFVGEVKAQYGGIIRIKNMNILTQFKDKWKIAAGSKMENKLFIIFNYVYFYFGFLK